MLKGVTAGPLAGRVVLLTNELDDIGGVFDGYGNAYGFDFRETILANQVDAHAVFSGMEMLV